MRENGVCRRGRGMEEVIRYGAMEAFTKDTGGMTRQMEGEG